MNADDLVRLDVGCEWNHYGGDLGRTVPVSGPYSADQREIWDIFVSAYHAGANQVFAAWSAELIRHRESARSTLAKQAVDGWSKREQVPDWQIHTMNLSTGGVQCPMRAGTTQYDPACVAFEPIASIGGQGYYLEDLFLITKEGAELLTPGVPYSAEEIELAMRGRR
jgi:Xaa-Pro aminopeptidase